MCDNLCGSAYGKRPTSMEVDEAQATISPAPKGPGSLNNAERSTPSRGAQGWHEKKGGEKQPRG